MGRINELFCDYLGRVENFADFWNGTLFRGIPLLRSKCFTRQDREYHKSQHKEEKAGVRRDVLMRYEDDGAFLLGIELMDTLDYSIPVRIVDYPFSLYQLKDLREENYQTCLREIIAVFKRSKNREAIKKYYLEHKKRFEQMDELAVDLMGEVIGNRKLRMFKQEKGGVDMCKAFEDEREEGREEGIRQSILSLMVNLRWTSEQAMEALGIPQSEREKYQQV